MSLELCAVIHLFWVEHASNQAILSELKEVYGKDVITLRAVEKWTADFNGGRTELICPGPGGPVAPKRSKLSMR
jgi:hypothetical protein